MHLSIKKNVLCKALPFLGYAGQLKVTLHINSQHQYLPVRFEFS